MSDDRRHSNDEDAIPEPDLPASDSEKVRARGFGQLVDDMLGGDAPPPALEAEQRELLEYATSIKATVREVELPAARLDSIIDSALGKAIGAPAAPVHPDVTPIGSARRRRILRAVPWVTTAIAAAAAVLLLVNRPAPSQRTVETLVEVPELSDRHLSRPSDALIGQIAPRDRKDATRASHRIDIIFADRMAGYRDLKLRGLSSEPRKGARQ